MNKFQEVASAAVARGRQSALDSLALHTRWLNSLEILLQELGPTLPVPVNEDSEVHVTCGDLYIRLPRIQETINKLLEWLKDPDTESRKITYVILDTSSKDGEFTIQIKHDCAAIAVIFMAKMEESTCVMTKVSDRVETKTYPVYEVTCKDALQEDTWKQE